MAVRTQHLHRYSIKSLPLKHHETGKGKCPVCGCFYQLVIETGIGNIYAHTGSYVCQVRDGG